jgi:hypothetical protein
LVWETHTNLCVKLFFCLCCLHLIGHILVRRVAGVCSQEQATKTVAELSRSSGRRFYAQWRRQWWRCRRQLYIHRLDHWQIYRRASLFVDRRATATLAMRHSPGARRFVPQFGAKSMSKAVNRIDTFLFFFLRLRHSPICVCVCVCVCVMDTYVCLSVCNTFSLDNCISCRDVWPHIKQSSNKNFGFFRT